MPLPLWLIYLLSGFAVVAAILLTAVFLWRRLYRELPLFLLYVISALLITGVRYATLHAGRTIYFYTYWITELAGTPVVVLALYEVFLRRLFVGFHKTGFYRTFFVIAAVVIIALTVLSASHASNQSAAFLATSQAFDFIRTGFMVFFVGLMLFMGRVWTRYDLGIALGFGLQAAVALVNSAVRIRLHHRPPALDAAEFVSYDLACLIWLITFWKPEKSVTPPSQSQLSPEMLDQAKSWEASLKDLVKTKKPSERN